MAGNEVTIGNIEIGETGIADKLLTFVIVEPESIEPDVVDPDLSFTHQVKADTQVGEFLDGNVAEWEEVWACPISMKSLGSTLSRSSLKVAIVDFVATFALDRDAQARLSVFVLGS